MSTIRSHAWGALALTIGVLGALIWHFNKPVDPLQKSDSVAKSAGFSSGEIYSGGLRLSRKVRREKVLSASDFAELRKLVLDEGESGQLLALTVILPLDKPDQIRQALIACHEALLNEANNPIAKNVLTSFRNRDHSSVNEFISRNPKAKIILEGKSE
ncbi:MAG: hypothetical protein ABL949_04510 [Fimbriimonadaceae bacterium]